MTAALVRLAGPLLFLAAGSGIVEASRALSGRTLPVRLAYGYVTGVAAVGLFLHAMTQIAGPVLTRPVVLALFGSLSLLLLAERPRTSGRPFPRPAIVPATIGAAVSIGLFIAAAGRPVAEISDSIAIWNTKARHIRAARTVDAPVIRDGRFQMEHPTYPALMPVVQVSALEALGLSDDDRGVKPVYAAFFPALLVIVFDAARRRAGAAAAALAATAGALLPQIATEPFGGACGTYSDLPLACFLGGGLLLLFERRPSLRHGALAGLFLAAATLTKAEGLPYALLGVAIAAAARRLHLRALRKAGRPTVRPLRPHLAAAAGTAVAGLLLVWWQWGIEDRMGSRYGELFSLAAAARGLFQRSADILRGIVEKSLNKWEWGRFWVAVPFAVVAGGRALGRRGFRPVVLFLVVVPAIPLAGYLVSERDVLWLVTSTWDRFLVQTSPFWLVLVAAFAREAWGPSRRRRARGTRLKAEVPE